MAVIISSLVSSSFSPIRNSRRPRITGNLKPTPTPASLAVEAPALSRGGRSSKEKSSTSEKRPKVLDDTKIEARGIMEFVEQSKSLIASSPGGGGGGPPRWFSPLECGIRSEGSPLLLYLPGIDGIGLGLLPHHQRLGKMFDIWCLHIPVMDRTPFEGLVAYVERTVKSENIHSPNKPIYLVGESLGACLALAIAARNPDIDFMLVLANPATSFRKSQLQSLSSYFDVVPEPVHATVPYTLSYFTGNPMIMAMAYTRNELPPQQAVRSLSESVAVMLCYLSFLADILPRESLLWKLKMLRTASLFANSRIHAVKAQMLVLASGRDQLLPSREEAERLCSVIPNCRIRHFKDSGHPIFLESGIDLVTVVKGACFYRRSKQIDHVSDYQLPNLREFQQAVQPYRWINAATSPVLLSTLNNGKIVRSLEGIPSEGPVILVGYHMLMGLELGHLISEFFLKRSIHLRGIAHPFIFDRYSETIMLDSSYFDGMRLMGAVPVSAMNFYKLLSRKSYVLLYPGGAREALHKKGEQYKLFWPEQSEFVRMAAAFGATIIPFGIVGEDDIFDLVLDYEDLVKVPFYDVLLERINQDAVKMRTGYAGEIGNQKLYVPAMLPKLPGRFYYLFGRPIETRGRKEELKNRERAHELYLHVKSEVENCIAYLKEKREKDPYRNVLPRLLYQATRGFASEVPTFDF